jgi:hypothetical protein
LTDIGRSHAFAAVLARAALLAGVLATTTVPLLAAQALIRPPRQLDAEAATAFEAGTPAQCMKAAGLWRTAADQYAERNWTTDEAQALRNAGRAYSCAGDQKAALGYFGRAADLDNPTASYGVLVALDRSPLYDPAHRGVAEEARFVGSVNDLLRAVSHGEAMTVSSVEDAQVALENLAGQRLATITVRAGGQKVDVVLRRFVYSITQPAAQWERVTTDVTIQRTPAAYHFRYRSPSTGRDTTLLYKCADGCTVMVR